MHFVTHFTIALISLIAIVLSCILFTNAIEFLGNKLKLGNNATGSILAVIGTGLPEFIVPIVAVFGANFSGKKIDIASDIALGAILGSPFMLSTLALFLLIIVLVIKKRNKLNVDTNFVIRDYKYFLLAYAIAMMFSFKFLNEYKIIAGVILFFLYGIFVCRTIVKSRCACVECECEGIYFKFTNEKFALFIQLITSFLMLILASHFFVSEIKYFSTLFGVAPSILALLATPFATELPECINSLIWLKQEKDELAISNILGAIIFQATLLFAIGIFLTPWLFNLELFIASLISVFGAVVLLFSVLKNKKISLTNLLFCGILYFSYLIFLLIR